MWEHSHTSDICGELIGWFCDTTPPCVDFTRHRAVERIYRLAVSEHQTVSEFSSENTDLFASWTRNWGCSCCLWLRCVSRRSEINSLRIGERRSITPRRRIALDTNTRSKRSTCAWVIKTIDTLLYCYDLKIILIHIYIANWKSYSNNESYKLFSA